MTVSSELGSFLDFLSNSAASQALQLELPLLGNALDAATNGVDFLSQLRTDIETAVGSLNASATASQIATALQGITGLSATATGSVVALTFTASNVTNIAKLEALDFGIGGNDFGFGAKADFTPTITTALNVTVNFDTATQALSYVDTATDELTLGLSIAADVNAAAKLGVIGMAVTDTQAAPEIQLTLGLDIDSLTQTNFTITTSGAVNLGLGLTTTDFAGLDFLPTFSTELKVAWGFGGSSAVVPTVTFEDVAVDLGSLAKTLAETLRPVTDFLNMEPVDTIIDAMLEPLPIIDDGIRTVGATGAFDINPQGGGDGFINMLDVYAAQLQARNDQESLELLSIFTRALGVLKQLADLNATGGSKLVLGSFDIVGGEPTGFTVEEVAGKLPSEIAKAIIEAQKMFDEAVTTIRGLINSGEVSLGSYGELLDEDKGGITFPIIENPELVVNILFPALNGNQPVDLVKYNFPQQNIPAVLPPQFFPILGPIGISFDAAFNASIDFNVKYDTTGLFTGNFIDGVVISSDRLNEPGKPITYLPGQDRSVVYDFEPIAFMNASSHLGLGLGLTGDTGVFFEGGIEGFAGAFLPGGELRYNNFVTGCIFDPVTGRITADLSVRISIGVGFLKWVHRETLLETTLVDFTYGCDGSATDPGFGLARVDTAQLKLHVGTEANLRRIDGNAGTDDNEAMRITNAAGGGLTVSFRGIQEDYSGASVITANFNNGNDGLVIDEAVSIAANVDGGAGDDLLSGGAGNDTLRGGNDSDILRGHRGNDSLDGGNGDDTLDGGLDADTINGGEGRDQVTYINSEVGVIFRQNGANTFIGSGGEADGDQLISIEYIVGSNFDDQLYGNATQSNTLEGRDGNDILVGGAGRDFLIGGKGADVLRGEGARDQTSYLTSWGAVIIDLKYNSYRLGDAEGDRLISIEDVQGTAFGDILNGSDSDNELDGWFGDDVLAPRGGADLIHAGAGNDRVNAAGDGDTLDGGSGYDILSYEYVGGRSVAIDLRAGTGADITVRALELPVNDLYYSSFEELIGTQFNAGPGDTLTGDDGYNVIRGLNGNDALNGGKGNDRLFGGAGADTLTGGIGLDWADYSDGSGGVNVNLATGFGFFNDAAGDRLATIENLRGTKRADILTGDANNNVIDPYLSLSLIDGLRDDVDGGGSGDVDILIVNYSIDDFGQGLTGGYDTGSNSQGTFTRLTGNGAQILDQVGFRNIEQLTVLGTIKGDTVYGGRGNDYIATNGGDDLIYAGTGGDVVLAGRGNDTVYVNSDSFRQLSFEQFQAPPVWIAGEGGRDTLSASFNAATNDLTFIGLPEGQEAGVNVTFGNGGAVTGFEVFKDLNTGSGRDRIVQLGNIDNRFSTGSGADTIESGLGNDFIYGGRNEEGMGLNSSYIILDDIPAFYGNPGDLLRLDYSSLNDGGVFGSTSTSTSYYVNNTDFSGFSDVYTHLVRVNAGRYESTTYSLTGTGDRTVWDEIERLDVTGTRFNDILTGTYKPFGSEVPFRYDSEGYSGPRPDPDFFVTVQGNDTLRGGDGDDEIHGFTGSDILIGGAGADTIYGSEQIAYVPRPDISDNPDWSQDFTEVDLITGNAGADTFVLGDARGVFYRDFSFSFSSDNRAVITDFNTLEDTLQLAGGSADYRTETFGSTTYLYYRDGLTTGLFDGDAPNPANDELIAELSGVTNFDLNGSYVSYLSGAVVAGLSAPIGLTALSALSGVVDEEAGPSPASDATPLAALAAPVAALAAPWVTQTNDVATLSAALFGGAVNDGIDHSKDRFELSGNGDSFGTFSGDPFGLGSGIVLSTGVVADLAGTNTEDGGTYPPQDVPLTFEFVGRLYDSDVFRADLSGLGIDISSFSFRDQFNFFGGDGDRSGFDLEAIVLSREFVTDVFQMNDIPKLEVFDYSAASMVFQAGQQHEGPGPNGGDFSVMEFPVNTYNNVINNTFATLGTFDYGFFSMGDGGSLGMNLTSAVSSDGPLYLYIAENGASGERLDSVVSLSSGRIEAPADLSTDFGRAGAEDDTTTFTYHFTVADASAVDTAFFEFALFSEELREFAGSQFNDHFSIKLNGVSLAQLSDGTSLSVNSLMQGPTGPAHPDLILNPVGGANAVDTRADAYSKVLTFAGGLQAGENTLTIEVADVRDGLLDSGILVKGGTFKAGAGGFAGGGDVAGGGTDVRGPVFNVGDVVPSPLEEGGATGQIPITFDPGPGGVDEDVLVTLTPDGNTNIGGGYGVQGIIVIKGTDGPFPKVINVPASVRDDGVTGGGFGVVRVEVDSADSRFDGLPVAPIIIEKIDPTDPFVSVSDVSQVEGNSGTTLYTFAVSRTGASDAFDVAFATVDGTAKAGTDYVATSGVLSFAQGEMTKTVQVEVKGDINVEADEAFTLHLSGATNSAVIQDADGVATIVNDDTGPRGGTVTISDVTKTEGNSGTTAFTFTVSRTGSLSEAALSYATADGTAKAGVDYTAQSGILDFAENEVSKTITVNVAGDKNVEPNETFFVNLTDPSGAFAISDAQGTGTINNDDSGPAGGRFSINDVTKKEGNSGQTAFVFTVSRTGSLSEASIDFRTADDDAKAGLDYVARSETLVFGENEASKTIEISVNGDINVERNEEFYVKLSNATNGGLIIDGRGEGTILNDDRGPAGGRISIAGVTKTEGDSGVTKFEFEVTRTGSLAEAKVRYTTDDGTAREGSDYIRKSGWIEFKEGESSKTITIDVKGDTTGEPDETFFVKLSDATNGAVIATHRATGIIRNDDPYNHPPVITSDGGGECATILVAENTRLVTDVDATDPDGTAITYSISGGRDRDLFKIDSQTGLLEFKRAPDYENCRDHNRDNSYSVVVSAKDAGGAADTQTLTVKVADSRHHHHDGHHEGHHYGHHYAPAAPAGDATAIRGTAHSDSLTGDAGNNKLYGWAGADLLDGGKGNDSYFGGHGSDTFVFTKSSGKDTVAHFEDWGPHQDVLLFKNCGLDSLADVRAAARQSGSDVIIKIDDDAQVTLRNFSVSNLSADDFRFL